MFAIVGVLSIALTMTPFTLSKSLFDFSVDYEIIGMHRLNMVWPPLVAFCTTGAHCYVYYNLFQTLSSKNCDHELEYTLAAAKQQ